MITLPSRARALMSSPPDHHGQNWLTSGMTAKCASIRQILLEACIRSGTKPHLALARQILHQNMVDRKIKSPTPANQRLLDKILAMA